MKCCICGAVKNVEKYLDNIFKNIEKIGSLFEDYTIILYYDTSQDNTLQKLKDYKEKNSKLNFYVNEIPISKFRTQRIANARNGCLQMIREKYNDFELFIMIDCDDVCSENINLKVLEKYLYRNDWDALSFNKEYYYDLWALSIKPYLLSCLHFDFKNNEHIADKNGILNKYVKDLLNNLPAEELLQCASAFNGFAIYRTNKFINCNYDGTLRLDLLPKKLIYDNLNLLSNKATFRFNSYEEDCEHRSFHLQAINKNGARIRISPEILFPGIC